MTIVAVLKCNGQNSRLIYVLAIHTIFLRQVSSMISGFRCLHETWSRPGVEKEEHLATVFLNSWFEKGGHSSVSDWESSFRKVVLMGWFSAKLCKLWRAFYKSVRVLHSWSLNVIVLMAGRAFFFTQFMRSHDCLFEETILYIFSSKNFFLASCIVDLYAFQLSISCSWYLLRLSVHSWFHYSLEYLVMYFSLECCIHTFSNTWVNWRTVA